MNNFQHLNAIILIFFTGLISPEVSANESSPIASRPNVAINTYTRTYITVSTPRHGQGTFTTYHAPTFPSNDSKVRYTRKGGKQNQNLHKKIQTKRDNLEQIPNVIYYYSSPEHTGFNNYNYTLEQTYQRYNGRTVSYSSSPSIYYYQQRPVTKYQFGQHQKHYQHSYQNDRPRYLNSNMQQQCLGLNCRINRSVD